eukprot:7950571-Karenia_brevis.AAC.1
MDMIQAKTIEHRPHPKLPPTSKIPFPQNQEFKYEKETFANKRKKTDVEQLEEKNAADEAGKKEFEGKWSDFGSSKAARKISPRESMKDTAGATA